MESTVFFSSKNNNCYLYDCNTSYTLLVHPLFSQHEDNEYYHKKYNYLKKHGFFSNNPSQKKIGLLSNTMVRKSLAQTRQIVFEVTDACNLKCKYCGFGDLYDKYDERNNKYLDINDAKLLLHYAFSLKKERRENEESLVISFYGGEPLLNINFIKAIVKEVSCINRKKIEVEYSMTTNATLLHQHIDFLSDNSFKLLISLDGNEHNNSYRTYKNGLNSFDKIIQNLDFVKQKYPKYFEECIDFNAVLHNRNSIDSTCDFIYTKDFVATVL